MFERQRFLSGGPCFLAACAALCGSAFGQSFPVFSVQTIPNPDGATFVDTAVLADDGSAAVNFYRSPAPSWHHGYAIRGGTPVALTPVSDGTASNHPLGHQALAKGITPAGMVFGSSGPCNGIFSQNNHASAYWPSDNSPVSILDPSLPTGTDRRIGCGVAAMNDRRQGAIEMPGSGSWYFQGSETSGSSGIVAASCSPLSGSASLLASRVNRRGEFLGSGQCSVQGVGSIWSFGGTLTFRQLNASLGDLDENGTFVGRDLSGSGARIWINGVPQTLTSNTQFVPTRMNIRGDVVGGASNGSDQIILNGTLYNYTQATGLLPPGYSRVRFFDVNDRGQVLVAFVQAPGNSTDPSIAAVLTPAPNPNNVRNGGFDGSFGGWRPWTSRFPPIGPPLAGYFPMPFGPPGNTGAKIDSGEGAAISQYVDIGSTPCRVRLSIYAPTPGGTATVAIGSGVIGAIDTTMLPTGGASVKLIPIPAANLGQQGVNLDIAYAGADGYSVLIDDVSIESYCPGDLNADAQVDDADFVLFAAEYNLLDCGDPTMPPGCPADFNADGFVEDSDFVIFAGAYDSLICP